MKFFQNNFQKIKYNNFVSLKRNFIERPWRIISGGVKISSVVIIVVTIILLPVKQFFTFLRLITVELVQVPQNLWIVISVVISVIIVVVSSLRIPRVAQSSLRGFSHWFSVEIVQIC